MRRRLEQLGGAGTVEQFRAEQVVWGASGLAAALGLAAVQVATGDRPQPLAVLMSAGVLTALGVLGRDRWLTREVSVREQRLLEEFPTVAEPLALAVTAGEGPVGALERVHRTSDGELSRELGGQDLQASRRSSTSRTGITSIRYKDPVVASPSAVQAVQRRLQRLPVRVLRQVTRDDCQRCRRNLHRESREGAPRRCRGTTPWLSGSSAASASSPDPAGSARPTARRPPRPC